MIFDLLSMDAREYDKRSMNVFFQNGLFKVRVINLKAGGKIPDCRMNSFVLFYVVKGEVVVSKNGEPAALKENQVFITEPALLSMETKVGARLMGLQIKTRESALKKFLKRLTTPARSVSASEKPLPL